jgi:hypothetical protein
MATYLPGIPDEIAERLRVAIQRPEGTFTFWGHYPRLLDQASGPGVLAQVVVGSVILQLNRGADFAIHYVQSSPGTGTREAVLNLQSLVSDEPCERFFFALVWSPKELRLQFGRGDGSKLATVEGAAAPYALEVDSQGAVHQIGSPGVTVMAARIYAGGAEILSPPAVKLWSDVKTACGIQKVRQAAIGVAE